MHRVACARLVRTSAASLSAVVDRTRTLLVSEAAPEAAEASLFRAATGSAGPGCALLSCRMALSSLPLQGRPAATLWSSGRALRIWAMRSATCGGCVFGMASLGPPGLPFAAGPATGWQLHSRWGLCSL